jgi:acetyl esterase/lipase
VHAENDNVDDVRHSLVYYLALTAAAVPVEMHVYARGGHAFGVLLTDMPIARWPQLFETWLKSLRMID